MYHLASHEPDTFSKDSQHLISESSGAPIKEKDSKTVGGGIPNKFC
jgi:hypothetical protein